MPPPTPAVAEISTNTQYGVPGFCTATANSSVGISRSRALTTVQLRPPNLGTANVYGSRSREPIRFGTATSRKSCETEKSKPILASIAALTLQKSQTEKPRCSARIDQIRLRRATGAPVESQNSGSSGRQSSIHRPDRRVGVAVAVLTVPPAEGASSEGT